MYRLVTVMPGIDSFVRRIFRRLVSNNTSNALYSVVLFRYSRCTSSWRVRFAVPYGTVVIHTYTKGYCFMHIGGLQ